MLFQNIGGSKGYVYKKEELLAEITLKIWWLKRVLLKRKDAIKKKYINLFKKCYIGLRFYSIYYKIGYYTKIYPEASLINNLINSE